MSCVNTVEQAVPRDMDYVMIIQPCGTTSIHGQAQYCEDCDKQHMSQGHRPNECRHGYNVWDGHCPHEECN